MIQSLIDKYKSYRKRKFLSTVYRGAYAFVGFGNHSIYNLYPNLWHFGVRLKYIVTKTNQNLSRISDKFPQIQATSDLDLVLNDGEVKGVFICADPKSHFDLTRRTLRSGKYVFVEKPPCLKLSELKILRQEASQSQGQCLVGLQKRYAPSIAILQNKLKGQRDIHYNYRFITGLYPEGDPILDIFIHPLDLAIYIYGSVKSSSLWIKSTKEGAYTIFAHLEHEAGVIGTLEFSTAYSWQTPLEQMVVNTPKAIYTLTDMHDLKCQPKQGSIFGIPREKVWHKETFEVSLLRSNLNPILQNNQLYTSGYYTEIQEFLNLAEGKSIYNRSPLSSLEVTYNLMEEIKSKAAHVH